jgi:FAD synthase
MIVTRDTEILKDIELVATIGFFDGVHLGHRFLIEEMLSVCALNAPATFSANSGESFPL